MAQQTDPLKNTVAEQALLGAMLLDNRLIASLADKVGVNDFAIPLHGRIYSAMLRFAGREKNASAVTMRPVFAADAECLGGAYLDQLVEAPAVLAFPDSIAEQVADLAARRTARQAMEDGIEALSDLDKGVDEICGTVDLASSAAARGLQPEEFLSAGDMTAKIWERIQRIRDNAGAVGLTNKLVDDFDTGLGLLETGTYNILAGRPGMGKSALASSLALGWALAGHCGIYIQKEMSAEQMALRMVSDLGLHFGYKIPHDNLRKGNLTEVEWRQVQDIQRLADLLPIRFVCPGKIDVTRLWAIVAQQKAMWAAQGKKLEWVVSDYIGLTKAFDEQGREIQDDRPRTNRVSSMHVEQVKRQDVAMLALAQISRGVEQRADKRPMISDLRDSGNLEQDADSVTLLYREEYYLEQEKPRVGEKAKDKSDLFEDWQARYFACQGKMDMIFAKNRHSRVNTKTVKFLGEFSAVRSRDFRATDETDDFFEGGAR
jgi:replicative DNA helicase